MISTEQLYSPKVQAVFRKHHITATGLAGVRQGHAQKGDQFMFDFLKAISPETSVLHGNNDTELIGPPTLEDWIAQQPAATNQGWDFWNTLLTTVGKTGTTIAGFKQNVLGSVSSTDTTTTTQKSNNTIIYVLAGIVILAIGYLIFKKSKA